MSLLSSFETALESAFTFFSPTNWVSFAFGFLTLSESIAPKFFSGFSAGFIALFGCINCCGALLTFKRFALVMSFFLSVLFGMIPFIAFPDNLRVNPDP